MSDKNIYQRINAVMKKIEYIKKDKLIDAPGQKYKVVTHDNVTAQVREHLVEEGIVIHLNQTESELLIKRDVDNNVKMHLYSGTYEISFVNMDKPEDRATVTISAHAADNGDKAPGKAASYATKYAILKLFSIETGEDEEGRTFKEPDFTDHQKQIFTELLESGHAADYVCFVQSVGPDVMIALNGSFEKGTISQNKAKAKALETEGWNVIKDYGVQISDLIAAEDPAVGELVGELTPDEKRLVANQLTPTEIQYLKSIK